MPMGWHEVRITIIHVMTNHKPSHTCTYKQCLVESYFVFFVICHHSMIAAHTEQTTSSWCMTLFKIVRSICITTITKNNIAVEMFASLHGPGKSHGACALSSLARRTCQQRLRTHIINKNVTMYGVHNIDPFPRLAPSRSPVNQPSKQ